MAQEISEKRRSISRTPRATQPVCSRMSKMLPMKMAERRRIGKTPQEKRNFRDKRNVAYGLGMVKRNEMVMCREEVVCEGY